MTGMTHGTESRYKEVITSMIGWCIFFNICKFDKLKNKNNNTNNICHFLKACKHILFIYYTNEQHPNKKMEDMEHHILHMYRTNFVIMDFWETDNNFLNQ